MADDSAEQQLLVATRDGNEPAVRRLLEGGGDIAAFQEEEEGASALILAAKEVGDLTVFTGGALIGREGYCKVISDPGGHQVEAGFFRHQMQVSCHGGHRDKMALAMLCSLVGQFVNGRLGAHPNLVERHRFSKKF
jgi:hypothetical protein